MAVRRIGQRSRYHRRPTRCSDPSGLTVRDDLAARDRRTSWAFSRRAGRHQADRGFPADVEERPRASTTRPLLSYRCQPRTVTLGRVAASISPANEPTAVAITLIWFFRQDSFIAPQNWIAKANFFPSPLVRVPSRRPAAIRVPAGFNRPVSVMFDITNQSEPQSAPGWRDWLPNYFDRARKS